MSSDLVYYPTLLILNRLPQAADVQTIRFSGHQFESHLFAPVDICLPYGMYGRLMMMWLTTRIVRRQKAKVFMKSRREPLNELMGEDLYADQKGARLINQLVRIFHSVFLFNTNIKADDVATHLQEACLDLSPAEISKLALFKTEPIIDFAYLIWLSNTEQKKLERPENLPDADGAEHRDEDASASFIQVSDYFSDQVIDHGAVPFQIAVIRKIFRCQPKRRVGLIFDLYCWLMLRRYYHAPYKETLEFEYLVNEFLPPRESLRHRHRLRDLIIDAFKQIPEIDGNIQIVEITAAAVVYRKLAASVSATTN